MEQRQKILIALKKARTSLDKIIAQLERGEEQAQCFRVMQQTLSVIGLLKNANNHMLAQHVEDEMERRVGTTLRARDIAALREEIIRVVQAAQRK